MHTLLIVLYDFNYITNLFIRQTILKCNFQNLQIFCHIISTKPKKPPFQADILRFLNAQIFKLYILTNEVFKSFVRKRLSSFSGKTDVYLIYMTTIKSWNLRKQTDL